MKYKYDLHCHTAEGSGCSHIKAADMVHRYLELGYTGIVITDHFTGNTTVPKDASWEERIERFQDGYRAAKAEGDKSGLDVFFGLEYSDKGNDFVFLDIGPDWLLANPDMRDIGLVPLLQRVRAAGGFITHAHPFAIARWIPAITLVPQWVDAVEVINGGESDENNARALWFYEQYKDIYNLRKVASTDTHESNARFTGIILQKRVADIPELINEIKAGRTEIIPRTALK